MNEIIQRLLQLEKLQNRLVQQVSNDVGQLAGAIKALQAENQQLKVALSALAGQINAAGQAPRAEPPYAGPSVTSAPRVVHDAVSSSGAPLAEMNEEDAEIMLSGEDGA